MKYFYNINSEHCVDTSINIFNCNKIDTSINKIDTSNYLFNCNKIDTSNNKIDTITSKIKNILLTTEPIDDILHVICVISNPCNFRKRYTLAKEFIARMEKEKNIILYVCELIYDNLNKDYQVTDISNCRHLQLKTSIPLWHKENMINIAIKKLLPETWKAVAWIDADIEFESNTWSLDTLKLLNGTFNTVQLFSHCEDLNKNDEPMNIFQSFGYLYANKKDMTKGGVNFPHPGYGWAYTRELYDSMGSIYDLSILGSGDSNMVHCLIGNALKSVHGQASDGYKKSVINFQNNIKNAMIGYVPGVIKHYFHGTKENRRYVERWDTLLQNKYDPYKHVAYNLDGIMVPTSLCPKKLLDDILIYFKERNEDE
jgi:hypothetical protein